MGLRKDNVGVQFKTSKFCSYVILLSTNKYSNKTTLITIKTNKDYSHRIKVSLKKNHFFQHIPLIMSIA